MVSPCISSKLKNIHTTFDLILVRRYGWRSVPLIHIIFIFNIYFNSIYSMKSFNIILNEFNSNKAIAYDIMPYLIGIYTECIKTQNWWPLKKGSAPVTFEHFKEFVDAVSKYRFWSRCEYEWLMLRWPYGSTDTKDECLHVIHSAVKIDGYEQIKMNLDVITQIFKENVT